MATPWDLGSQFVQMMSQYANRDANNAAQTQDRMIQSELGRQNTMMGHNLNIDMAHLRDKLGEGAAQRDFSRTLQRDDRQFDMQLQRDDMIEERGWRKFDAEQGVEVDKATRAQQIAQREAILKHNELQRRTGGTNVLPVPPMPEVTDGRRYNPMRGRLDAQYVHQALVDRGVPSHVAQGMIANFRDESGLRTDINEAEPLVKGSRGGYGLYQLTGLRRRQFERWAAQNGRDVADGNAQLDFLMLEGSTTEKRAFQRMMNAKTPQEAAVIMVNEFLRPAPEHAASRSRRYAGMGGATASDSGNNDYQDAYDAAITFDPSNAGIGPIMSNMLRHERGYSDEELASATRMTIPKEAWSRLPDAVKENMIADLDLADMGDGSEEYVIFIPPAGWNQARANTVSENNSQRRVANPPERQPRKQSAVEAAPITAQTGAGRRSIDVHGNAVPLVPPGEK